MSKKSTDEKLQELIAKQQAIKNRIMSLEARKRKYEDKILTRKKILIGAYILQKYKDKPNEMNNLHKELSAFLTRNNDRVLFELKPIANK